MITARPEESKPVLVGKSVHNQRIERHNCALNEQVMSRFRGEFYQLESEGVVNVNNDTDILCLHYVYLHASTKQLMNLLLPTTITEFPQRETGHLSNYSGATFIWQIIIKVFLPEHAYQPDISELMASD